MIPAAAVVRALPSARLAAGRRSPVAHLVSGRGRPFTPENGRLRSGWSPRCGQRARLADPAGRLTGLRLCDRCARLLPGPVAAQPAELADVEQAALAAAGRPHLSRADRDLLDAAGRHFQYDGSLVAAGREVLPPPPAGDRPRGALGADVWQALNRLLDDPAAAEYAPQTVARWRRIRGRHRARRNLRPYRVAS